MKQPLKACIVMIYHAWRGVALTADP